MDAAVSAAILTVDANRLGRDVLSRFEPMVLDRLYHSRADVVAIPELQQAIEDEFGLKMPGAALQTISRRAARRELLEREHGVLRIVRDRLAEFDLTAVRAATRRDYEALIRQGASHSERVFGRALSPEEFGAALWSFIQRHASPLLAAMVNDTALPPIEEARESLDFVVASFIVEVQTTDAQTFDQLAHVAKGAIIASAIYFPDPEEFEARLNNLTIFLDTTILLRLVGASGPELRALAQDLVRLASARGAKIACFEHTLREVRGVLAACTEVVRRGTSKYYGEASEYMVSSGWEVTDVVALSDSLEERLETLDVAVQVKPPHMAALTLDEDLLEKTLQEHVHYTSPSARHKDIDSITAIYRLRHGRSATTLSRTNAVFITHNTALVRASRAFEKLDEIDRGSIPLCTPDFSLTTHLWVSQQVTAPDLPIRSLVADSYSVMRADDHVWRLYLEKIEELRATQKVTDVDYILLRQSLQVRSLLMHETHCDPDAFTEGSARRVLEHARRAIQQEALDEAAAARAEATEAKRRAAETEAAATRQADDLARRLEVRQVHLEKAVEKVARTIAAIVLGIIGAIAVVGALFAIPFVSSNRFSGVAGLVVSACVVLYAALSLAGLLFGFGLPSVFQLVQSAVHRRVLVWYERTASGSESISGAR